MITIEFSASDLTAAENAVQNAFHCADSIARQTGDDVVLHDHHGRTALAEHNAALRDLAATAVDQYAHAAYELGRQNPNRGRDHSQPAAQQVTVTVDAPTYTIIRQAVQLTAAQTRRLHQLAADESILHRHHDLPDAAQRSDVMAVQHRQQLTDYERVTAILDAHHPATPAADNGVLMIVGVVTAAVRAEDLSAVTALDAAHAISAHLPSAGTSLADGLTLAAVSWDQPDIGHLLTVPAGPSAA